jgi:uridine phosphorylase
VSEAGEVTESSPILEFDPTPEAMIEPAAVVKPGDVPAHVVLCYFQDIIERVVHEHGGRQVARLRSEIGDNPIYEIDYGGRRLALVHPGVGAPLAAGFLEELIALGCRAFVAAGGAGVLVPELGLGHVIVPTAAIRDEGTSYHYLPPGREVAADPAAVAAIIATLVHHNVPYVTGKTWTTDALYRETRTKLARRVAEGCLTVEMEAAACFAVAAFRGVPFGQLVYAGDDLSGEQWDERGWVRHASGREMLFRLAAESVLRLAPADTVLDGVRWQLPPRQAPSSSASSNAAVPEPEVTLTDGTVTLRPWRPEDAPSVLAACQDPLIARFIPIPQPYTETDADSFVASRRRDWETEDERSFAIVDAVTGELLGSIARHGPFGHRATYGYWLVPHARGRGNATRALRLITDWTVATTDVVRLDLYTDLENDASGRVAQRVGFEREGIRRAWDVDREGRPIDVVFYVLVRDGTGNSSTG